MSHTPEAVILKSKKHFHLLDGLRGIAAIAVVIFHYMEWIKPDISQNFIGHGFLAVDFFLCLSGFVIAYAYDNRLPKMRRKDFFISRLIRLHPLVIIGSILGLIALLADPFANHAEGYSLAAMALIFLASMLMIPLPVMEERGFNLFGLNAPSWSLFWEYIANILYAFVLIRLSRKTLWVLLIPAAIALVWVSYSAGNLLGGWDGNTFLHGGVRMSYSFLAGLLIFRSGWIIKNKLGFVPLALMLSAAFFMPWHSQNWITESLIVLLYFPFIVALGAGSALSGVLKETSIFLGKISYPLYMTHYAAIWMFGHYFTTRNPTDEQLTWIIAIGTALMIFFAWLVMQLIETPVRKYLTRKRKEKLLKY
ncbi:acyltransferase [Marinilabilia salmonicolor]|jgi:peptidoglycan/LPS O-acetylase OafA/YrhL|uniref:Peptidoglycan/LPS O-acetylase OafA/YrhL n=1 Tax=Marinilabilia salmonicolor TaxID=989 RepID=A0A2T0XS84_9BACT|nr:acyltransferase [Marinilabilia salmonicolor]PRZ01732.1 peptidoglycan/LPS O-acetylase OafA/YrhL [Marinilabilia salmonicolor]RCW31308.1 peptidoglycan/LPS O-acetylase OafA/YrhL [Marinilabilia salmonicolor]